MKARNMNCAETRTELSEYMDRTLRSEKEALVRQHIEGCAECEARTDQLSALRGLLRDHARMEPPVDLALQIRLRVSRDSQPAISTRSRLWVHIDNLLRPIAIPALSGLLST